MGDSARNLIQAIERLAALSDLPLLVSSLWETTPVDCPPGSPPFVNAVVSLVPRKSETPESLLSRLQTLEQEFGRPLEHGRNEPRPLDLDLIAFGEQQRAGPGLVLPHPRAHLRQFVLQPLAELHPELKLPGQQQTVAQLLSGLRRDASMRVIAKARRTS